MIPSDYNPKIHKAVYRHNYAQAFSEIDAGITPAAEAYRYLCLNDLFFIAYFVMENPLMNCPFGVRACDMVQDNDPYTGYDVEIWARGHLKAVDVDEPVLTTCGWTKHGDLDVGDYVFGINGKPIEVISRTEISEEGDFYCVKFDTGYEVVVNGDHLWTVDVHSRKRLFLNNREGVKTVVLDTRELMKEVSKAQESESHVYPRIPIAEAIDLPEQELPIHPYVFGLWLGDGTRASNNITSGLADYKEITKLIKECGHKVSLRKHSNAVTLGIDAGICGKKNTSPFNSALRKLGIFKQKSIPSLYMFSSKQQRWELLQGLMDTDGTCHHSFAQASFSNTNEQLANQVHTLACSLGLKATIHKFSCVYNGVRRPFYQVMFKGFKNNPPFKMKRKIKNCSESATQQTRYRRIKSITKVPPRPVSCITVDSQDGLYLIGTEFVATHNSWTMTQAQRVQRILQNPEKCALIMSYKKPASDKFVFSVMQTLEKPILIQSFPDILWDKPSTQSPSWSIQNGIIVKRQSMSRKEKTLEGAGLLEGMPTGGHWDDLDYDDVETKDTADSPDVTEDLINAYEMSKNLGMPDGSTRRRVIGTFYSHFGLLCHLRDKKNIDGNPLHRVRIIPATDNGEKNGKPIFLAQSALDELKSDAYSFNTQQLCNPTPTADIKLNFNALRRIESQFLPKNRLKFIIVDPAGDDAVTKGKNNDSWAIGCLSIEPVMDDLGMSKVFIEDIEYGTMPLETAIDTAVDVFLRNGRITGVGIERVGTDTTYAHIISGLKAKRRRAELKKSERDFGNVVLLSPDGKKKTHRIESSLAYPWNNGMIFYVSHLREDVLMAIKNEADKFPFFHVDILDMISYIYKLIEKMKFNFQLQADEEIEDEDDYVEPPQTGRSMVSGY